METQDILEATVGAKEQPKNTVGAATVRIASVEKKETNKEGKKLSSPLLQFHVKHPEKEELITLSKIKFIEGDKVVTKGFWVQLDEEGNFYKGSTVDILLEKLGVNSLAETYGKDIATEPESKDSPYLCFKAY